MNNLIKKLIERFNKIKPEDNKPIKMAIMELDNEYQLIKSFGLKEFNNELNSHGFNIVEHVNFPDGLKCFTLEKI